MELNLTAITIKEFQFDTRTRTGTDRFILILTLGKITTLSKNWARSSSKLSYEHASSATEAQAIAPSLAPNHSRAQWRNFYETVHPQYCTQMAPFRTTANIQVQGFAPK